MTTLMKRKTMSERHARGQKALSCHEFRMFDQVNAVVDARGANFDDRVLFDLQPTGLSSQTHSNLA